MQTANNQEVDKILNPRPETLPLCKIRVRRAATNEVYTLVQVERGLVLISPNHNHFSEARITSSEVGIMTAVELDRLELHDELTGFTLLDTWSADTEFPELLECC